MFAPINPDEITTNDIQELYYILPVVNLPSVLEHGILSHNAVSELNHMDISNAGVQDLREKGITSPRSKKTRNLHDYVNFYLQPFNAMLLVIQDGSNPIPAKNLCLLRISKTLLEDRKDDAILTNQNAARFVAAFFKPEDYRLSPTSSKTLQSRCLKGDDSNYLEYDEFNARKPKRQAEALFRDHVPSDYISGIFVSNDATKNHILPMIEDRGYAEKIEVTVKPSLFPRPQYNAYNQRFSPFEVHHYDEENTELDTEDTTLNSSITMGSTV